MPTQDNPSLEQQIATQPLNPLQPSRFGGISELVKDVFTEELTYFFNTTSNALRLSAAGLPELPRISKYSVAVDVNIDPLETAVALIRTYPDIEENMPLLAVLSTTGQNRKLSISNNFTSVTIPSAQVVSSIANGPYTLADGMTLQVTTQPDGVTTYANGSSAIVTSTYIFNTFMFVDIANATLAEVINAINFQALYAKAYSTSPNTLGQRFLAVKAGGTHGTSFPNQITVIGGTAVTALGFTVSQTGQNFGAGKQAYERHHMAADLTIAIEVVAESENVRTELSDLLYDFLTFVMADRSYQFYGRSSFDSTILDETYQIILKDSEISFSGEQEIPRTADPKDKIYINRISVPVLAIMYTDRIISDNNSVTVTPLISVGFGESDLLPEPN